ncbi:hypothetical protein SCHPADRAFT_520305 [Schizopora paradoxa]|uniref:Uncharacterized protein n=1 Tax=Schizopora paradoxa TaxID=27342 RepID=A0A0H2S094_9AGAM|nr:hypothetical protein SCHPADRAFT_520305 [Schizopora paradoxa]
MHRQDKRTGTWDEGRGTLSTVYLTEVIQGITTFFIRKKGKHAFLILRSRQTSEGGSERSMHHSKQQQVWDVFTSEFLGLKLYQMTNVIDVESSRNNLEEGPVVACYDTSSQHLSRVPCL